MTFWLTLRAVVFHLWGMAVLLVHRRKLHHILGLLERLRDMKEGGGAYREYMCCRQLTRTWLTARWQAGPDVDVLRRFTARGDRLLRHIQTHNPDAGAGALRESDTRRERAEEEGDGAGALAPVPELDPWQNLVDPDPIKSFRMGGGGAPVPLLSAAEGHKDAAGVSVVGRGFRHLMRLARPLLKTQRKRGAEQKEDEEEQAEEALTFDELQFSVEQVLLDYQCIQATHIALQQGLMLALVGALLAKIGLA